MIDVFLDNLKVRLLAAGKIVRILPSQVYTASLYHVRAIFA